MTPQKTTLPLGTLALVVFLPLSVQALPRHPPRPLVLHSLRGPAKVALRVNLRRARPATQKRQRRPAPQPLVSRRVGWGGGEQLTFEAHLGPLLAGRLAIAVGAPKGKPGSRVLRIRGRTEPIPAIAAFYRLQEDLVTTVDLHGVLPLKSSLTARHGSRVVTTTTEHGTTRRADTRQWVRRGKGKARLRRRSIGRQHHDPLTAFLALRSVPLTPGKSVELTVITGRKTYRLTGKVLAKKNLRFHRKKITCIGLEGEIYRVTDQGRPLRTPHRRFTAWLSADRRRIPIAGSFETKYGSLRVDLTSYHQGKRDLRVHPMALR